MVHSEVVLFDLLLGFGLEVELVGDCSHVTTLKSRQVQIGRAHVRHPFGVIFKQVVYQGFVLGRTMETFEQL